MTLSRRREQSVQPLCKNKCSLSLLLHLLSRFIWIKSNMTEGHLEPRARSKCPFCSLPLLSLLSLSRSNQKSPCINLIMRENTGAAGQRTGQKKNKSVPGKQEPGCTMCVGQIMAQTDSQPINLCLCGLYFGKLKKHRTLNLKHSPKWIKAHYRTTSLVLSNHLYFPLSASLLIPLKLFYYCYGKLLISTNWVAQWVPRRQNLQQLELVAILSHLQCSSLFPCASAY